MLKHLKLGSIVITSVLFYGCAGTMESLDTFASVLNSTADYLKESKSQSGGSFSSIRERNIAAGLAVLKGVSSVEDEYSGAKQEYLQSSVDSHKSVGNSIMSVSGDCQEKNEQLERLTAIHSSKDYRGLCTQSKELIPILQEWISFLDSCEINDPTGKTRTELRTTLESTKNMRSNINCTS